MPFYLRLENGDRILLEIGGGYLILEQVAVPPATINYQGGAGHPVGTRKRKRHETQELFASIERTLQEALGLVEPDVAGTTATTRTADSTLPHWTPERLEATLADLATVAAGAAHYERRLTALAQHIHDYEQTLRDRDDDEEFWMLLS
jgi:hypothetical protein